MISIKVLEKFSHYPGDWWKSNIVHPLGLCEVVGKGDALVGVGFNRQMDGLERLLADFDIPEASSSLKWEDVVKFNKILVRGTPFQVAVWEALLKIPAGETKTYSEIAQEIGSPKAVRAVGTAVGSNPVSIIIPCHRVLPKAGGIGNYHWGAALKEKLLELE